MSQVNMDKFSSLPAVESVLGDPDLFRPRTTETESFDDHLQRVQTRPDRAAKGGLDDPGAADGMSTPETAETSQTDQDSGELSDTATTDTDRRPAEEFYDLRNDPHEIHNLVDDPEVVDDLKRHRKILETWTRETDDQGRYDESAEGLLQVLYRWGDKCVNPEYERVRRKYGIAEKQGR